MDDRTEGEIKKQIISTSVECTPVKYTNLRICSLSSGITTKCLKISRQIILTSGDSPELLQDPSLFHHLSPWN